MAVSRMFCHARISTSFKKFDLSLSKDLNLVSPDMDSLLEPRETKNLILEIMLPHPQQIFPTFAKALNVNKT